MANATNIQAPQTQAQRRLKYGLNVAVASVAALALVVLINVIVYRSFYRMPAQTRDWLRFDLTATRQYSLSDQTRRVLEQINDDYRVVTLFRATLPEHNRVKDLIDEYARLSSRVRVEHIDPESNYTQRTKFFGELRGRYAEELKPVAAAIEQAQAAMTSILSETAAMAEPIGAALENPELADGKLKEFLTTLRAALPRTQKDVDELVKKLGDALGEPLPNYSSVQSDLSSLFTQLDGNLLAVATDRFNQAANDPQVPSGVKDTLIGLSNKIEALREQTRGALSSLRAATVPEKYTELTTALATTEAIVVAGPGQVRVLDVNDMFRVPDPQMVQETGDSEVRFVGEERLTGALVSLSVEKPALVVFVLTSPQGALGPQGAYESVAQRLRAANFEVEQWNPMGQFSMMGGQAPPEPAPEPEAGQKRVWVVLPFPPPDPRNPMAGGAKPQVVEVLKEGLAKGDSALVMPTFDAGSMFGGGDDPLADLLKGWGITPQTDRVIMREEQLPERRTRATAQFLARDWPGDLPISKALGGMEGAFLQTCPLVTGPAEGVKTYPLVELSAPRMWAESDISSLQSGDAKFREENAAESFVVGVAAEKGEQRLVAVADPVWASEVVTAISNMQGLRGAQAVEVFGQRFPANSELFVNSVYWLAGLDQLIAASPRSQDIRRVENLSDEALTGYRVALLGGLPVAIIACGMGVWLVRRRG